MSDFDDFDGFDQFDRLDAELGAQMRGLSDGGPIDAAGTLQSMRPALRRARAHRRLAVVATSATMAASLVGVAFAISNTSDRATRINFAATTTTKRGNSDPSVTAKHDGGRTTTTRDSRGATTTSSHGGANPGNSNPGSSNPGGHPGPTTTLGSNSGSTPPHAGTTTTQPGNPTTTTGPNSTTTTTQTSPQSRTDTGIGGSVTVGYDGSGILTRSYVASSGYSGQVTTSDQFRYEVRFTNGSATTDVKCRVRNGVLDPPNINDH